MIRLGTSAFDRPDLAAGNLLRLDPTGAFKGLIAPESLTPAQRTSVADQLGVGGDDWFGRLLRVATNPIVVIGAILAIRYPIPLAKDLFNFAPKLTGLLRNPGIVRTRFIGNIDSIFAGLKAGDSTLPEVYKQLLKDVQDFRRTRANTIAQSIVRFQGSTGREFDKRLETLLAAKLDGLDVSTKGSPAILREIKMGPAFDRLVSEVRGVYDDTFKQVNQSLKGPRLKVEAEFARARGVAGGDKAQLAQLARRRRDVLAQLEQTGVAPGFAVAQKEKLFFPRVVPRTLEEFEDQTKALVSPLRESEVGDAMISAATRVTNFSQLARRGKMIPNRGNLAIIKDLLINPKQIEMFSADVAARAGGPAPLREYSLNFLDSSARYLHGQARAFGWTVQGAGDKIASSIKALRATGTPNNIIRASMLENSYVPVALGRSTFKQTIAAAQWDSTRLDLIGKLKPGSGLAKILPTGVTDFLTKSLTEDRGITSLRNVQGRLASTFYVGALGGNPVSSAFNLMQTLLTTIPVIGPKATFNGLERVFQRAPKYFASRKLGLGHDAALAKAFPEFGKEGLAGAGLTDEALELSDLGRAWELGGRGLIKPNTSKFDRVKSAMMALFQSSETVVRLTAFEGTLGKAIAEGVAPREAATIARRVTEATQFLSGPANVPAIFRESGPLLRQFGTFTGRYADFLFGTATEIGSGAQAGGAFGLLPDRNLGTLGRALLSSGLAYGSAKEFLNQDISRGLLFGALPIPPENAPFFPAPFVPPIVSLVGAAGKDLLKGEFNSLRNQLPLFVPGGVSLARFSTLLGKDTAGVFGRDFADYENQLPDGRIPLMTRDGRLKAFVTPLELFMEGAGIPPGGSGNLDKVREVEQFLLNTRDKVIRPLRRQFFDALLIENDARKAEQINQQYQKALPGFGPIQIRRQDIEATKLRVMVTRLESIFDSLPADLKPQLGKVVQTALGQKAESLLGVDPSLLTEAKTSATTRQRVYDRPLPTGAMQEIMQRRERRLQTLGEGRLRGGTGRVSQPGVQGTQEERNRTPRPFGSPNGGF